MFHLLILLAFLLYSFQSEHLINVLPLTMKNSTQIVFSWYRSYVNLHSIMIINFKRRDMLQIVQLTASGDFNEALALCKHLPPEDSNLEDSNLRAARESGIHLRRVPLMVENLIQ